MEKLKTKQFQKVCFIVSLVLHVYLLNSAAFDFNTAAFLKQKVQSYAIRISSFVTDFNRK